MEAPQIDLEVNAAGHLSIVQACLKHNPDIKIVYAGPRQIYGRAQYLPVDEKHPIVPVDFNGVTKRAGNMYHMVSYRAYGLHATSLRLINTYGPRMHCKDGRLNFLGEWIRRLFDNQPLQVFGAGEQIRDLNFVDDVVDALLLAVSDEKSAGQIYNNQKNHFFCPASHSLTRLNNSGRGCNSSMGRNGLLILSRWRNSPRVRWPARRESAFPNPCLLIASLYKTITHHPMRYC